MRSTAALQAQCLSLYNLLVSNGYQGDFFSSLYVNVFVKPLKGSYTSVNFAQRRRTSPALKQIETDLDAYQSGASAKIDIGRRLRLHVGRHVHPGAEAGGEEGTNNITPENVQKVTSTMTYATEGHDGRRNTRRPR